MRVRRHEDVSSFLGQGGALLEAAEAENNLMLGVAGDLVLYPERWSEPPVLITVEADGEVCGAALRTPPWNLILTRMPAAALGPLLDVLDGEDLPGVIGPAEIAGVFADGWGARRGVATRKGMAMRVFELREVVPPARPAAGVLRRAVRDELPLVTAWAKAFHRDAGVSSPVPIEGVALEGVQDGRV